MSKPKTDYTRDELISICERAIVDQDKWNDRDSSEAHTKVGMTWAFLRAGCVFTILSDVSEHSLNTDHRTIWLEFKYKGFFWFEDFSEDAELQTETAYLPTPERLDNCEGHDWY